MCIYLKYMNVWIRSRRFFILMFWLLFSWCSYFLLTLLVDSNEIYCYGKHAGQYSSSSSQDTEQGPWGRLCLAALLIYIVDFYQRHHCAGMSMSMVPSPISLLPPPSQRGPAPTCRLISNTCNECLNCHYHLLVRVMFFGCHVSKYCEKISSPTPLPLPLPLAHCPSPCHRLTT